MIDNDPRTNFNILIVHGVGGYPQRNWFGAVAKSLRDQGHNVVIPQMPTLLVQDGIDLLYRDKVLPEELASYDRQTLPIWLDVAYSAMKGWSSARTILIGHSLGGLTVLRLAEQARDNPYHAVFSVSPVAGPIQSPQGPPDLTSFYENINGDNIRAGAGHIAVFVGDDDAIVPAKQSLDLAKLCKADKVITIENGGHLNAESGYLTFPRLLQEVRGLLTPTN